MGLFGGNSKKKQTKAPLDLEGVKSGIINSMNSLGQLSLSQWDASMSQSFASFGFDELDLAEVVMEVEDLTGLRFEEGEFASPQALLMNICRQLDIAIGVEQKPVKQAYETDIVKKLGGASHLLRCGNCGKGLKRSAEERCGVHSFNCPACKAEQYDLGPLPTPYMDLPMGGYVTELRVPEGDAQTVIKWFCSWCGCTVGGKKQCGRCECDLTLVPPQYGAVFVNGDEERARNLSIQATAVMSVEVALIRLLRATPKMALKASATKEFAAQMLPEDPPPTALVKSRNPFL